MLPLDSLFVFPFMLLLCRIGAVFMVFPIFSDVAISTRVRLLMALLISMAFFPLLADTLPPMPVTTSGFIAVVVVEVAVGILLGLAARIMFSALSLAGEMIAFMAGFQSATLFDPSSGANTAAPSIFLSLAAGVLFLALNLHHVVIQALVSSYQVFPVGELPPMADLATAVTNMVAMAFALGVQLAAPVIVAGFIALAMFGVFNRLIPQLQVFFVSVPISISLSLLVMAATVGMLLTHFTDTLAEHLFITEYDESNL